MRIGQMVEGITVGPRINATVQITHGNKPPFLFGQVIEHLRIRLTFSLIPIWKNA